MNGNLGVSNSKSGEQQENNSMSKQKNNSREALIAEIKSLQGEDTGWLDASKRWVGKSVPKSLDALFSALWNFYADTVLPSSTVFCLHDEDFVETLDDQGWGEDVILLPTATVLQHLQKLVMLLKKRDVTHVAFVPEKPGRLVHLVDTPVADLKQIRDALLERQTKARESQASREAQQRQQELEEQVMTLSRTIGLDRVLGLLLETKSR
jgi:hypothetical protein